jgi:hypothetical protein
MSVQRTVNDVAAWTNWCEANRLDAWGTDAATADEQLADWLYWRHRSGVGYARLVDLAGTVSRERTARSLPVSRAAVTRLRRAIARTVGTRTETRKVDPLTRSDIDAVVVGALIRSGRPTAAASARALAVELGHRHGVPSERLVDVRGVDLGGGVVRVDGTELPVETELDSLRDRELVFGPMWKLRELFDHSPVRGVDLVLEPCVGAGLSDEQARWVRFGVNRAGRRALMWVSYVLVGNAFGLRHSDLARMRVEDVVDTGSEVAFTIHGGKKLDDRVGVHRLLEHDHDDTMCAACALWSWVSWRKVGDAVTTGPVFSSTEGPGTGDAPVSAVAARSALQRAVRDSALATRRIGTRSLRVGTATEMAAAGVPLADIMAVTGHRSVSEAVRYIRLLSPRFQPHLDV